MKEVKFVTIIWPDTQEKEVGEVLEENEDSVMLHSNTDGSINWVPKKYIKKE